MKILGIIPARYQSTRFPGKPLADILGKPMIWHVYKQAKKALENVIIATDDNRIFETAIALGLNVVMTSQEHNSGTERCYEALEIYQNKTDKTFDFVINIQGDEPLIDPKIIISLSKTLNANIQIATLIRKEEEWQNIFNPNFVKVIFDNENYAIYFSRNAIPFLRDVDKQMWGKKYNFYTHIGIYGYKSCVLEKIVKLKKSKLEQAEKLEQLRWIENGFKIKIKKVDYLGHGVDTKEDLEKVINLLKKQGYDKF